MCSGLMAFFNIPTKLNIPNISFRSSKATTITNSNYQNDRFVTNPIYHRFGDAFSIEKEAQSNPRIQEIAKKYNIPIKVNETELNKLKQGHLKETRLIAAQIYSAMPQYLKDEINLSDLQNAALLHDYGKILIPEKILNKTGKLNDIEREIVEQHSEIGYELLKNKGLNQNTLNLIKYHHQNCTKTGYPKTNEHYEHNFASQILSTADKYTALIEKRSYKNALSKLEALEIIAKDVKSGQLSQQVYTALVRAV